MELGLGRSDRKLLTVTVLVVSGVEVGVVSNSGSRCDGERRRVGRGDD